MTEYLFTEQIRARSQDVCPDCEQDFNTTEIVHICPGSNPHDVTKPPAVRWLMQQRRGLLVGTGRMDGVTSLAEANMLMALPPGARAVLVTKGNNKMLWRDRICKWMPNLVPVWFQTSLIARPNTRQIVLIGYESLSILHTVSGEETLKETADKIFSVVDDPENVPVLIIADVVDRLGNSKSKSRIAFRILVEAVLRVRGRVWGVLSTSDGLSHREIVNVADAFDTKATEDLFFVQPGGLVQHPKRGGFRFGFDKKYLKEKEDRDGP